MLAGGNKSTSDLTGRNKSTSELTGRNKSMSELTGRNKSTSELTGRNKSTSELAGRNKSTPRLNGRNKSTSELSGRIKSTPELKGRKKSEPVITGRRKPSWNQSEERGGTSMTNWKGNSEKSGHCTGLLTPPRKGISSAHSDTAVCQYSILCEMVGFPVQPSNTIPPACVSSIANICACVRVSIMNFCSVCAHPSIVL